MTLDLPNVLTKREKLVVRLRDQKKLAFPKIAAQLGVTDGRVWQIYHAARKKIQFPPNGLSHRSNRLLTIAGFTVEKEAIAHALRTGKLYSSNQPPNYGRYTHREVCRWAGVDPVTLTWHSQESKPYPANGLSHRANNLLKYAGIPATKKAVHQALKQGDLLPTKRPVGYGKITHAELSRWAGVDKSTSR